MFLPVISVADTLGNKTIKKIHVNLGSGIYFETNEPFTKSGEDCSKDGLYQLAKDGGYEKEAYSLLLFAYASGRKVSFYVDGCYSYPKVTWINSTD